MTPLSAGAGNGHATVVAMLLDAGADANLINEVMYSCALCVYIVVKVSRDDLFEYVCRYSNIISKYLTRYRSILNQHGQTALLVASDKGYASVVKLLIDAKADVNLTNKV